MDLICRGLENYQVHCSLCDAISNKSQQQKLFSPFVREDSQEISCD